MKGAGERKEQSPPPGAFCHRRWGCRVAEVEQPHPLRKRSALNGAGSLKPSHSPLRPRPLPPGAAPPPPRSRGSRARVPGPRLSGICSSYI